VDAIILDFPDPHHLETAKLYSVEFYKLLALNLKQGGMLVTQATSPLYDPDGFGCIRQTLQAADFNVCSYHVEMRSFGQWGFHCGSLTTKEEDIKQTLWNWNPQLPLKWLDGETMRGGLCWRPGFLDGFKNTPINDLFHLPLMQLYQHQ
jgi:spermidine synthase